MFREIIPQLSTTTSGRLFPTVSDTFRIFPQFQQYYYYD